MKIVVPIHVAALRISPSTQQTAKTALYDFSALGQFPLSQGAGLLAADRLLQTEDLLSREPGIHLHWSLPKVYTQGTQSNTDGGITFPALPNRWLITRFYRNANGASNIAMWILEADAHAEPLSSELASQTALPWKDSSSLYDLRFHYAGRRIPLGVWKEPGKAGREDVSYLSGRLVAPLAYGPTFTAYYPHCRNLFGIYDDLGDLFANRNELELDCKFSVSYSIVGWASPLPNDIVNSVLGQAVEAYKQMPEQSRPAFPQHIRESFEERLQWTLDDYSSLGIPEAANVRGILSGLVSGIQWDIAAPANASYPSTLPDAAGVRSAIGNNTPEALAAYLASLASLNGGEATNTNPKDVPASLEWLLNALQFGRLPDLGEGELGVGQLDQYLHSRSFGSTAGGYLWSVRELMSPGSKAAPGKPVEVTLPLPLARLLSELNLAQQSHDSALDEISTRRQKVFFDWCYHVNAIGTNVVPGSSGLGDDTSKDYLVDGILQLFPCMLQLGTAGKISTNDGPYRYAPSPFRIPAPASRFPGLPDYVFNRKANDAAGSAFIRILDLYYKYAGEIPEILQSLRSAINEALTELREASAGGSTADAHTSQAISSLGIALGLAQQAAAGFPGDSRETEFVSLTAAIDADAVSLRALTDPVTGIFAQHLAVTEAQPVPLRAGEVYRGTMKSPAAFGNAASWGPRERFPGIKDLLDQLTGERNHSPHLFETSLAAIYAASAYFWRVSGETATHTTAYYLELALREIKEAQAAAEEASSSLSQAMGALTSSIPMRAMRESLTVLSHASLPAILKSLTDGTPDIGASLAQLQPLVDEGDSSSVGALISSTSSANYKACIAFFERAWEAILHHLPLAQQVSLLSTYLDKQIRGDYEIGGSPAPPFWRPNEPVLLLAEPKGESGLIRPVNRNGHAALLPCRLPAELIRSASTVDWPQQIRMIESAVDPADPAASAPGTLTADSDLAQLLGRIVEEAFLLSPELETVVAPEVLERAALQNQIQHSGRFDRIEPAAPPQDLIGKLPYSIAWNWWSGLDPFLPLFLFWQTDYVFSQRIMNGTVPPQVLDDYHMDQFLTGYQPVSDSIGNFQKDPNHRNYFDLYGVVTLASSSGANLCDQIRGYCTAKFNYDPALGGPNSSDANYEEEKLFFETYSRFRTLGVLSQGLGGFNAGLLQRLQELQLPLNIPSSWVDPSAHNLPREDFWPSQFLLDLSADWPAGWSGKAPNFRAFATGDRALTFSPLRAGFLQLRRATLVDAFGRFVDLPGAIRPAVAESMQSEMTPNLDSPTYLPPRLVQPSRLLARWISAGSPDGVGDFTEWNPHPAASPICGWVLPNHLDASLVIYNSDGVGLGSLRQVEQRLRWFSVPGEPYPAGVDNRAWMLEDLTAKQADPELRSFLETFAFPEEPGTRVQDFQRFLKALDLAQQSIITKSMQEDQSLAVLIGQPLALARCSVSLQLQGPPYVSLDSRTYPPWNSAGPQFQLNGQGYIPYQLGNFNDGGVTHLRVPILPGAVEYRKNGESTPYFDDGLAGYFVNGNYGTFYTPVDLPGDGRVRSAFGLGGSFAVVTPAEGGLTLTLLLDPRASVHITSGILPLERLRIPADQYARAVQGMLINFLIAPALKGSGDFHLPVPSIPAYNWDWWQVGQVGYRGVSSSQAGLSAVFPNSPIELVDGWLRLKTRQE